MLILYSTGAYMKCLVFSKTLQFSYNNTNKPHQPKIDVGTNENLTIRPTPLV